MAAKEGFYVINCPSNLFDKKALAFLRKYQNVKFPSKNIKNYARELPHADRERYEELNF